MKPYGTIAEITAMLEGRSEHHICEAVTPPNSSGGPGRFRAFCRCGWVGAPTDSRTVADARIREHLEAVS